MSEQTDRFPSLAALQDENDRLLDELEADGQLPGAFWGKVTAFIARAQATGAILDNLNERRAAQSILDYWDNALYRADRPAPGARLAEFDIDLAPDLKDQPCPYRGLAAFDENSAEFFFGRRALISQMVAKVRDGARLMVVVGPSGSGKSSVVRAGLLRELKRNGAIPGSESWCYVSMVPGAEPVENLDRALEQATPAPAQRILLVVDQFEEVFTVCEDPQARLDFEARLLEMLETPEPEHVVILTLREDFVDSLSQLRQLYTRYREPGTRVNVEAMDINELREVIEGPAAIVGLRFEEGVVDDLASKVLGERAGLPLLQFTLLQLWEKRRRNRVTKEVYEDVGSPLKALEKSADHFYGRLAPESKTTARMILLEMVHPGEGKEFTSNRVPLESVFGGDQSPERVEQVVYRLICEARLVKITGTDQDICSAQFGYKAGKLRELMAAEKARGSVLQIEVAHEALVRNWPQLETWLEEERKTLQARWDFRRQAERWAESEERSEWLARGAALEAAAAWPNLSALEQRFVRAGRRAEMLDRALRVGGLAVVIVGALLAVSMLWQVERVRRRQVAISSTAAQALIAEDKELEERIGWALKAYVDQDRLDDDRIAGVLEGLHLLTDSSMEADVAEGLSVEAALRSALKDAPAQVLHRFWNNAPAIKVQEIVASPDGRRLATLSLPEDSLGLVPALWDWQTGQQQVELRPEVVTPVTGKSGLVFSDDGSILAGIGGDGAAYLWNASDGTVLRPFPHDSDIARIWLGPAGSGWLASATYDQSLHLWDTRTGAELWSLNTGVWPPQLAFSGDRRRIAVAVQPGSLCLIDPSDAGAGGEPVCMPVALPENAYLSDLIGCPRESCFYAALAYDRPQVCDDTGCLPIAEAPTAEGDLHFPAQAFCAKPLPTAGVTEDEPVAGNLLDPAEPSVTAQAMLAAYDDATIQTWDVTDPMSPTVTLSLFGPTGLQDALLRRDCAAVGTVGATGGILYDATTGAILAESPIEPGDARQLYNIGGGIGIASADRDDAIRLWGFARTGDSEPLWRGGELNGRSVSPDGRWAAMMTGNEVTLVNLRTRESRPIQLGAAVEDAVLSDTAEDIRLGPGGRLLLWRAFDGSIRLMETARGTELSHLQDAPDLQATAMAADLVATVEEDGIVRLWDTADLAADASQPITFSQPITDVRALALSLDGKWLAVAGRGMDDRLRVWDVEKKAPLTLPEITDVQALALNGDGTRLAVMHATPDGTILPARVTVWDIASGQKAAEMSVANALPVLAFNEGEAETDTSYLVVAHGGNGITTISRHFIAPQDLARKAAAVTGCRLETEPEQDRYANKPDCEALLVRRPRER